MIEHIPDEVTSAYLYFHSAGSSSTELQPFVPELKRQLPNTYIWAGDGGISDTPIMHGGAFYGASDERYWFMFPMQDSETPHSFQKNSEAMGASLLTGGAFVNGFVEQVKDRFGLSASSIVLSGFQHGSCLALAASMMRTKDPFKKVILFEPYILEGYYLENEALQMDTTVVCIESEHMRNRVKDWLGIETDKVFAKFGMNVSSVVVDGDDEKLSMSMINEAVNVVRTL